MLFESLIYYSILGITIYVRVLLLHIIIVSSDWESIYFDISCSCFFVEAHSMWNLLLISIGKELLLMMYLSV